MVILGIVSFQTGRFDEMFNWTNGSKSTTYRYMPAWVREIGAMLQILPLIVVPFVGLVQTARYFLYGPHDLTERFSMLYRPSYSNQVQDQLRRSSSSQRNVVLTNFSNSNSSGNADGGNSSSGNPPVNDPPPKYTPPPSYSTATGARLARFLRQSFRQSVRRIRGITQQSQPGPSQIETDSDIPASSKIETNPENPPDYATVIIESGSQMHLNSSDDSESGFNNGTLNSRLTLISTDLPMASFSTATSTLHNFSTLSDHQPRSLGRTAIHSNSFRFRPEVNASFSHPDDISTVSELCDDSPSLHRFDSQTILVQSAQPIDSVRIPEPEIAASNIYVHPVDLTETSCGDEISLRNRPEDSATGNIAIIIPEGSGAERRSSTEAVVLEVDTSTSVI